MHPQQSGDNFSQEKDLSMRIAHRLVPGLLAGSLLAGGATGALAATGTPQPAWIALGGQISALSGSTFTLTLNPRAALAGKTPKTVQVTLAANAKQQPLSGTTATLANGDYAVVVGTGTQTAVTATRTIYSATTFPTGRLVGLLRARHTIAVLSRHTVQGTVQTGTTTSLTITTRAGKTLTFQLTPSTSFRANGGLVSHTAPAFTSGQKVVIVYTVDQTTKQPIAAAVAIKG
jgi:hypothetical protein